MPLLRTSLGLLRVPGGLLRLPDDETPSDETLTEDDGTILTEEDGTELTVDS